MAKVNSEKKSSDGGKHAVEDSTGDTVNLYYKVAVCLSGTFCHDYPYLSSIYYHQGKQVSQLHSILILIK